MGDPTFAIWFLGSIVVIACAIFYWRTVRRVKAASGWPVAEATIQSAELEKVGIGRKASDLPCFAFSYVVKRENYSGRFALRVTGDRADNLMRQMIDKTMAIRYDPTMPRGWYIPVDTIGGCEVIQNLRPKLVPQGPKD
jgi:hypothetical protein